MPGTGRSGGQRSAPGATQRDVPRADRAPSVRPAAPAARRFRIQISADRTVAAADSMATKFKRSGLTPVIVQEGGVYKLRVGEYPSKAAALAAVPEIRAKVGGSPFVVEDAPERGR